MDWQDDLLGLNRSPHFYTCSNCKHCCYDKNGKANRTICNSCYESLNKRTCTVCNSTYYLNKYQPAGKYINGKWRRISNDVRDITCASCASSN